MFACPLKLPGMILTDSAYSAIDASWSPRRKWMMPIVWWDPASPGYSLMARSQKPRASSIRLSASSASAFAWSAVAWRGSDQMAASRYSMASSVWPILCSDCPMRAWRSARPPPSASASR